MLERDHTSSLVGVAWVEHRGRDTTLQLRMRQFKRMAVIWAAKRDDRFMLPAVAFIVRFRQATPIGKSGLCRSAVNVLLGTAKSLYHAATGVNYLPTAVHSARGLRDKRGLASFQRAKRKVTDFIFRRR
jgi:hypothetical protein